MAFRSSRKQVLADARGTALLELALIFPLVMFLVLGAVDYALGFVARLKLEQSVNTVLQEAVTVGAGSNYYDYLSQEAANISGQPLANISLSKWLECDGQLQPSFTGECNGTQVVARYVSLKIVSTYQPPLDFRYFGAFFSGSQMSTIPIAGSSRLRIQ